MKTGSLPSELRERVHICVKDGICDARGDPVPSAWLGTISELLFDWARSVFAAPAVFRLQRAGREPATRPGIDAFEILGDNKNEKSLTFIVWEVKGTDGDPRVKASDIYHDLEVEVPRRLATLVAFLTRQFGADENSPLARFVSRLIDMYLNDSEEKNIGGCVVHDSAASSESQDLFCNFQSRFPGLKPDHLHGVLIHLPDFGATRSRVWDALWNVP